MMMTIKVVGTSAFGMLSVVMPGHVMSAFYVFSFNFTTGLGRQGLTWH